MSHVAQVKIQVRDLEALAAACRELGLVFDPAGRTYRWYGTAMSATSAPAGFTAADLGRCDAGVIRIANATPRVGPYGGPAQLPYEIGVSTRRDGQPGYCLLVDEWAGGHGLIAKVGDGAQKLVQAYATQVAMRQATLQGFRTLRTTLPDGSVRLQLTR